MKKQILCLVAMVCAFCSGIAYGQNTAGDDGSVLSIERNNADHTPTHITFASDNIRPKDAQKIFERYMGVNDAASQLRLISSTKTKQNTVVDRYAQYYNGVKIEYSSFSLMSKDDKVSFVTCNVFNAPTGGSVTPRLTEKAALGKALANVGAQKYIWDDTGAERFLQMRTKRPDTSYYPKGTLAWIQDMKVPMDKVERTLHLAWRFDVYAVQPLSHDYIYVDAATGKILQVNSMIHNTNVPATGSSIYSGTVSFMTSTLGGVNTLNDSSRGASINTYDLHRGTSTGSYIKNGTSTTWAADTSMDAHWGAENVYDYWKNVQGRLSYDNANGEINSFVHYSVNYNNAFWDGYEMIYGDGSGSSSGGFDALVSQDVCAHEIGHGVCQYTAALLYASESGAMNEGFSDCWGATIEAYSDPHETDAVPKVTWSIGEEIGNGTPLRTMNAPKLHGQPDTYLGTNWRSLTGCVPSSSTNDNCYVHTNSGVFLKWYYLLTVGGAATNDIGSAYSVTGLGFTKAANILYQTELVLTSSADYNTMRATSISVATTLYGSCAPEVQAVTKAWYAVGVGANFTATVPSAITGTGTVCQGSTTALTDVTSGGTWTSASTSIATVNTSGVVTGAATGTTTITFTVTTGGCYVTAPVTVNALPSAISGTATVCIGATTTLSDAGGGTWGSSNTSIATVVSTTGVVSGVASGTATITYTLPTTGCKATTVVTVNPLPSSISGNTFACPGTSTTLSDAGGGAWTSGTSSVATVVSGTGVVTGVAQGTATITYTLGTGCKTTTVVTINPLPSAISGTGIACVGLTTTLSDAGGGAWTSGGTSIATVISGTGVVTGVSGGTTTITYTLSTGCIATKVVTINPLPSAISGAGSVCIGATTTLSDAGGGNWTSGTTSVATVVVSTGVVTGVAAGTSVITYALSTGCQVTSVMTVNAMPSAITGTTNVCAGLTTTLSDAGGGAWTSSNTSIAAVVSGTGVVTGSAAGTATITYTLSGGCFTSTPVTVNPLPSAISGTKSVCAGLTTALSDAGGGAWTSGNTTIATVSGVGLVTGNTAGTATITYTLSTGCIITAVVTVNPTPSAISGTTEVCVGLTTTLSDAGGGAWTSGNTSIATIVSGTGVVTGVASGTAAITYTLSAGCQATTVVTVDPSPSAISGTAAVCVGLTTTLSDAGGGAWTSGSTSIATVVSGTGVVTGASAGTSTITYTLPVTGCRATMVVTVNPLPGSISGISTICIGMSTTLSDAGGGTWTSGNTAVATVGVSTGIVNGGALGTAVITYTLGTGCINTVTVTVNTLPSTITGTPTVCAGLTSTLSDAGGGTWSSANTTIATVVTSTGVVTGVLAGTTTITFNAGAGCNSVATVTVYPLPSAISGTAFVCAGLTTTLSDAGGGAWTSGNTTVATIDPATGLVSGLVAGTSSITYTLPNGCIAVKTATVNPLPSAISGATAICAGASATLSDAGGGTWTSGNTSVATIGLSTGTVNALVPGSATITYTLATGCATTTGVTVSIVPGAITGTASVCAGLTTTLSNSVGGGSWTSGNTSVAAIGSGTGIVSGTLAGTSTITYSVGPGCLATIVSTVNPLPSSISGTLSVCAGLTTALSDAGGGAWNSGNTSIATISGSGVVTGVAAGTSAITYTLPTGCITVATVTVNPLPSSISGTATVCAGLTTTLSDAGGGAWTSGNTTIASVVSGSGVVTGVAAGTTTITYKLSTGCIATQVVTVYPLPSAISGVKNVCAGLTTTLSDAGGGAWSSGATSVATVGPGTGIVSGVLAGTAAITYTLSTGCITTAVVTVDPLPAAISGPARVCEGLTITLSDAGGGAWTSGATAVATIGGGTGIVSGVLAGTATITYTLSTGCINTMVITVDPLPATISGTKVVCEQSAVTLSDAGGGAWSSSNTSIATVGAGTGIVSGILAGTTTITYTLPTSCVAVATVTVNPLPAPITGTPEVCEGLAVTLSDATGAGTWSSSATTVGTISGGGVLSGVLAGVTNISYTLSTGCNVSVTATVDPLPAAISGTFSVCPGLSVSLSDAGGGTWTSSNTSIATVGLTSGSVTGVNPGTLTITYTLGTGCTAVATFTVNGLPVVPAITGTRTALCATLSISLSDALSGGLWSSSNTSLATVNTSGVVTGVAGGSVNISYSVTNICGTVSPIYAVTVNALPVVAPLSGAPDACVTTTSALSDITLSGVWSSTGTSVATVSTSGLVTGVSAGTTVISYTVTNIAGCVTAASTLFTVHPPLTITATPASSTSFCTGGYVTLNSTTGSGFTYQWQVGGADISGATNASYNANYSGNFNVVIIGTGICRSVSPLVLVTVNPSPIVVPAVSVSASPDTILCVTTSPVTFTPAPVNGGSAPVYKWYVNGTPAATGGSFVYSPASGDRVNCRMTSNATCAFPDTAVNGVNMTISPLLTPSVNISASPGAEVCAGTVTTFAALITSGGAKPAYSWNKNGVNVATGPSYTYTPVNGDVVLCTLTSDFRCVTTNLATDVLTVVVDTPSLNKATIKATSMKVADGRADTFTVSAPHGGPSPAYQWYVNGVSISGATSSVFITDILTDGQTISCTETSGETCTYPATAMSNTLKIKVATGIGSFASESGFTLIPNPNNGNFSVTGDLPSASNGSVAIVITDVLGQAVYRNTAQARDGKLNTNVSLPSSLANGMYMVSVTSGEDHAVFHMVLSR